VTTNTWYWTPYGMSLRPEVGINCPTRYVEALDYDALAARLTQAECLLDHIASYGFPFDGDVADYKQRAADSATACRYPACVENGPEGKCIDWLTGACKGPPETVPAFNTEPDEPHSKRERSHD
jgi:hypothetical protein